MTLLVDEDREQSFAFDIADRLRKCLRAEDVGVAEIAADLGVTRTTVGNWIGGRTRPSEPALKLWALRFGVRVQWLRDGTGTATAGPDGDGWAPRGSNPQPTDYKVAVSAKVIKFPERPAVAAAAA